MLIEFRMSAEASFGPSYDSLTDLQCDAHDLSDLNREMAAKL